MSVLRRFIALYALMYAAFGGSAARRASLGARELLQTPLFARLMLVSALVLGSHAMHDAFAVIRWSAGGVTPARASMLWSEAPPV